MKRDGLIIYEVTGKRGQGMSLFNALFCIKMLKGRKIFTNIKIPKK
jgi:hypothetical protein